MPKESRLAKFCRRSDLHGLTDFHTEYWEKKKPWRAYFWLAVFLVALGFLIYFIISAFTEFVDKPIVTSENLVSSPQGVRLPSLYLCPSNVFYSFPELIHTLNRTWLSENVEKINPSAINNTTDPETERKKDSFTQLIAGLPPLAPGITPYTPESAEDFFLAAGYPTDKLFLACNVDGTSINCADIVFPTFDSNYGKCFLVRLPEDIGSQKRAGIGLKLFLDLDFAHSKPTADIPTLKHPFRRVRQVFPSSINQILSPQTEILMIPRIQPFLPPNEEISPFDQRSLLDQLSSNDDFNAPSDAKTVNPSENAVPLDNQDSIPPQNSLPEISGSLQKPDFPPEKPDAIPMPNLPQNTVDSSLLPNVPPNNVGSNSLPNSSQLNVSGDFSPVPSSIQSPLADNPISGQGLLNSLSKPQAGAQTQQKTKIKMPGIISGMWLPVYQGLHFSLHDPEAFEPNRVQTQLLSAGSYNKLELSLEHVQMLPFTTSLPAWSGLKGDRRCYDDDHVYEWQALNGSAEVLGSPLVYSVGACHHDCLLVELTKKCGCVPPTGVGFLNHEYQQKRLCEPYEEYTMTFNNFMADVGGLFGLWLGPSLVTLLKLIYVFFTSFCSRRTEEPPQPEPTECCTVPLKEHPGYDQLKAEIAKDIWLSINQQQQEEYYTNFKQHQHYLQQQQQQQQQQQHPLQHHKYGNGTGGPYRRELQMDSRHNQ